MPVEPAPSVHEAQRRRLHDARMDSVSSMVLATTCPVLQKAETVLNEATQHLSQLTHEEVVTRDVVARDVLNKRRVSYEYSRRQGACSNLRLLFSFHGTFWPLVLHTHELYLFPLLHASLVAYQWAYQRGNDEDDGGESEAAKTDGGRGDDASGGDDLRRLAERVSDSFWGDDRKLLPWQALNVLNPLLVFALVLFLSQCYARYMVFFTACQRMETSVQDLTVLMLTHATSHVDRWNAVRYLTAAASARATRESTPLALTKTHARPPRTPRTPPVTLYMTVGGMTVGHCKPTLELLDWARLLQPELAWLKSNVSQPLEQQAGAAHGPVSRATWETMLGWSRPAGAEEEELTRELHARFGTSAKSPDRRHACPALLKVGEVNELREYPDEMMTLVLLTWCAQSLKVLEAKGELKGPSLGQAHGTVLKLRMGARKIRNLLHLPVPLPYYHTLGMMQNTCFALYSFALLSLDSFLTPIVLFVVVLVTVGLREVAVALSNPFGRDDVDFPVDRWIVQLRAMALLVHPDNRVCMPPQAPKEDDDDDEDEDEDEENEEGDGDNDGADFGGAGDLTGDNGGP